MFTRINFFFKASGRDPGKLTNEKKLIDHLKSTYSVKWGRPVLNTSHTLFISIGITLIQILDLVRLMMFSFFFLNKLS